MAISHKPGVNNWNNGRYKNTYTVTKDIKYSQPIKVEEQPKVETPKNEELSKVEEQLTTNPIKDIHEITVEEQLSLEESKQIKPKK
jgi:hypothetical protein